MISGLALALGVACGGPAGSEATPPRDTTAQAAAHGEAKPAAECPTEPIDVERAPGTREEHRDVEFWLAKLTPDKADEVLVPATAIAELNTRFSEVEGAWHDPLDPALSDPAEIAEDLDERMAWIRGRVEDGRYVEGTAGSFARAEQITRDAQRVDELRMVVEEASVWCVALDDGLYKTPIDLDFDRNRCASLHPGEIIRVLQRSPDESWVYVHSGHTTGWLHAPQLTPTLPGKHLQQLLDGPRLVPTDDDQRTEGGRRLRLGTSVPIVGRQDDVRKILVPTTTGLVEDTVRLSPGASEGALPLTRRHAWSLALSEQDTPYGWGGRAGHRDCSRLMRDVMSTFGLQLARHSGVQGKLGTDNIDVSELSEQGKIEALRQAAQRGVVLLYMPGHIMMYLGEDDGQQYAVSAISEYLVPCEGGPDTVYRPGRVAVTTLELGRDSERTAYIERLSKLVVFAPT
ncbi:MAG: NlpC/P60 family protein [Myxococcota bacterium]